MMRAVWLLLLLPGVALGDGSPLFDPDKPLELTLEFPVRHLMRKAADRPAADGVATYTSADGEVVSLPVQMSTRGKSRLTVCQFPPLSLSVRKKAAKGTVFEGQKSLKIVTHCRSHTTYRGYLLEEQAIYEAFNVLTDVSFRTRLAKVTYRDTENEGFEITEDAFFIESIGEVASRNGLERKKVPRTEIEQLDPGYAQLVTMFQYLIGNTDWSVKTAPAGSNCCHNGRILGPEGEPAGWKIVPYDFDQAGFINAEYAAPAEQLRIGSVRQRLWRGRCVHNAELDNVIALFNERRAALESALIIPGARGAGSARRYVDAFFDVINDPKKRRKKIEKYCLAS